jgi:hypothetical protein
MDSKARRLTVEVDRTPFAEAYGGAAAGEFCHLIGGVLAGLVSVALTRAEVRAALFPRKDVESRTAPRGRA